MTTEGAPKTPNRAAQLEQCLALLRQGNEHKYVGLTLVPKLVRPDDTESIQKVAEAVGLEFLAKMIKSSVLYKEVTDDISATYLELAMTILGVFAGCNVEICAGDEYAALVPHFKATIEKEGLGLELVRDAVTCLRAAAEHQAGREAIIDEDCVDTLVSVVSQHGGTDDIRKGMIAIIHRCIGVACPSHKQDFYMELVGALPALSRLCACDETASKFDLMEIIAFILSNNNPDDIVQDLGGMDRGWMEVIHGILFKVLSSKIGTEHRRLAFHVASLMLRYGGLPWALPRNKESGRSDTRFLLLLMELMVVEMRVVLEGPEPHSRSNMLAVCFELMEFYLLMLTDQDLKPHFKTDGGRKQSFHTMLDSDQLVSIQGRIHECVNSWLFYLKEREDKADTADPILMAIVRTMGLWLSEEEHMYDFKAEILSYMPIMLEAGLAAAPPGSSESPAPGGVDFMLKALVNITADKDMAEALVGTDVHVRVLKYSVAALKEAKGCLGDSMKINDMIAGGKVVAGASTILNFVYLHPSLSFPRELVKELLESTTTVLRWAAGAMATLPAADPDNDSSGEAGRCEVAMLCGLLASLKLLLLPMSDGMPSVREASGEVCLFLRAILKLFGEDEDTWESTEEFQQLSVTHLLTAAQKGEAGCADVVAAVEEAEVADGFVKMLEKALGPNSMTGYGTEDLSALPIVDSYNQLFSYLVKCPSSLALRRVLNAHRSLLSKAGVLAGANL